VLLREAAGLDRTSDLGGKLRLALNFGGVGVAQVSVDVGTAFFDSGLGVAAQDAMAAAFRLASA
jgi:hypothetical protein